MHGAIQVYLKLINGRQTLQLTLLKNHNYAYNRFFGIFGNVAKSVCNFVEVFIFQPHPWMVGLHARVSVTHESNTGPIAQ